MLSELKRTDPYTNFSFEVEFLDTKLIVGSFSEVSGLEISTEIEEYQEGGSNNFVYKFLKGTKHRNLILKKGITDSDVLYKWYLDVVNGLIKPQQISVILLDSQRNEVKRWVFQNAIPVKWTGSDLNATSNGVMIESMEFIHQGILNL